MVRQAPHCSRGVAMNPVDDPLMEEVRGARKEVETFGVTLGPPKLDFGQEWGKAEMSSCHDDLYGRAVFLMHSC